jgi:hypothetical protein
MSVQAAAVPGLRRHRRHGRPQPALGVVAVEGRQHRHRMVDRRRRIPGPQVRLAGARVHRPRPGRIRAPPVPGRIGTRTQPQHEITDLRALRPVPRDIHRGQEPEPSQQVISVRPARGRAVTTGQEMPQEVIDGTDPLADLIHHDPRQHGIIRRAHRPDPGDSQSPQVTPASRRAHPASVLVINEDEACPIASPGRSRSTGPLVRSIGRCTLVGEIPTRRASSRLDQCMAPSGTSSKVRTTTSSTWASLMVRGTPGRGSSPSPSSRRARNRAPARSSAASPSSPASAARPQTAPAAPASYHPCHQQTADQGPSHHLAVA